MASIRALKNQYLGINRVRQRIASRMVELKQKVVANIGLDVDPSPLELLPLDDALQQLSV